MTHTTAIKIEVAMMSLLLKLVSNQTIEAMPISGIVNPPGILNIPSELSSFFNLNFIVAKTTIKYISNIAALANKANCLKSPAIEKIKIKATKLAIDQCGVANFG